MPDKDKFKEFLVGDLGHADVFNTKVYIPGEENRKKLDQHLADKTNPHDTTWDQTGAAKNPHGNEHHDPNFALANHGNEEHDPNFASCPHGNECHEPDFLPASEAYVHPPNVQCDAVNENTEIIEHGNEWHSPNFAVTNHGNEEHNPNFALANHGNEEHNPNFADISSGAITYYLDGTNGNDSNSGTTVGQALKTWAEVESRIPRFIDHQYEVVIVGNYNGNITLNGRILRKMIMLKGINETQGGNTVNGIIEMSCVRAGEAEFVGDAMVNIKHLRVTGQIRCLSQGFYIENCEPRFNSPAIFVANLGQGRVQNCDFGINEVDTAIRASSAIYLLCENNTGTANNYGYHSDASLVFVAGTKISGDVAQNYTARAGQIFE